MEEKTIIEPMMFNQNAEQYIMEQLVKIELADIRKMNHMTQQDMSKLSGLSVQCISDIESQNKGNPTLRSLNKYLNCLGYELNFQKKTV